jgi:hypothetical protein
MSFMIDMSRSNLCFALCLLKRGVQARTYDSDSWITQLQINFIALYKMTLYRQNHIIFNNAHINFSQRLKKNISNL